MQNPSELASLSTRESLKADAMKSFPEEELNKFLDALPTKELVPTTNSPAGSSKTRNKK